MSVRKRFQSIDDAIFVFRIAFYTHTFDRRLTNTNFKTPVKLQSDRIIDTIKSHGCKTWWDREKWSIKFDIFTESFLGCMEQRVLVFYIRNIIQVMLTDIQCI